MASVGNIDKDGNGCGDVVIGAKKGGTGNSGRAYLVLGSASPINISLSAADAVIDGAAASDEMGIAIGGVSDMDSDSAPEILIGAYRNDSAANDAGAVHLIYGDSFNQ